MRFKKSTTIGNLELPQDRHAPAQDAGLPICDPCRPVDIYALTAEQWLAAEQMFHVLCNRAADLVALQEEWISESRDCSNWILPKPRELHRYQLLDAYELELRLLPRHDGFADVHATWLATKLAWDEMPKDLARFDAWLTYTRLVHMCVDPTHRATQELMMVPCIQRKNRRIRWPRWLLGNSAVSRSSVPQDEKVDGQQTSGVSPLAGGRIVNRVNSG